MTQIFLRKVIVQDSTVLAEEESEISDYFDDQDLTFNWDEDTFPPSDFPFYNGERVLISDIKEEESFNFTAALESSKLMEAAKTISEIAEAMTSPTAAWEIFMETENQDLMEGL